EESIPPPSGDGGGGGDRRGELRLRVLQSLPQAHLGYLSEKIKNLCRNYLRNKRVPTSKVTPDELLSEVWQKLLGTVLLGDAEAREVTPTHPPKWTMSPIPEEDGRVVWLINEIGGTGAIAHRYEDVMRRRWGRTVPGRGRLFVQPGD